jgi:hypothetical protein
MQRLKRIDVIASFRPAATVAHLVMLAVVASAADNGQVPPDIPDNIRAWFKSVRSSNGVPCCDIADGHRTAWRGTPSGGYEVPVDGDWIPVPPEAVILNAGNPVGEAIVWYVRTRNDPTAPDPHRDYYVRCFVPGNGA